MRTIKISIDNKNPKADIFFFPEEKYFLIQYNSNFTNPLTVTVYNGGDNTQNSVQVKIMAYDEAGNSVDEKTTTFDRSLTPHGSLTKVVTVPKSTTRCDCVIQNSNPQ